MFENCWRMPMTTPHDRASKVSFRTEFNRHHSWKFSPTWENWLNFLTNSQFQDFPNMCICLCMCVRVCVCALYINRDRRLATFGKFEFVNLSRFKSISWRLKSVCVYDLYNNSSQDFKLYISVNDCDEMCVYENSIIISILNLCCSQSVKEKKMKKNMSRCFYFYTATNINRKTHRERERHTHLCTKSFRDWTFLLF